MTVNIPQNEINKKVAVLSALDFFYDFQIVLTTLKFTGNSEM